jgi:hypothetical protein
MTRPPTAPDAPARSPATAPAPGPAPGAPPVAPKRAVGSPAPAPSPSAPPATPARMSPRAGIAPDGPFLSGDSIDVEVDEAIAAIEPRAPVLYAPPPSTGAAGADWPATTPAADQAEAALVRALDGAGAAAGLDAVAAQVAAGLTDLEREILRGAAAPIDAEPIRRAAVMRVRVAAALASRPRPGTPVDDGAVHAFLAELDALLSAVGAQAASAPAEVQGSLDAIRSALVTEAIDFSEMAQRVAPASAPPVTADPRPARRPLPVAGLTKVLDFRAREEASGRGRALWVLVALAVLGGGGFHLHRYLTRPEPLEIPTLAGAPDGLMLAAQGGKRLLVALPGKRIDPMQLDAFRAKQSAAGIEVREIAPGTWILDPAPSKAGETR